MPFLWNNMMWKFTVCRSKHPIFLNYSSTLGIPSQRLIMFAVICWCRKLFHFKCNFWAAMHHTQGPFSYLWLSKVLANERRRYICNVFSHWPRPCSANTKKGPLDDSQCASYAVIISMHQHAYKHYMCMQKHVVDTLIELFPEPNDIFDTKTPSLVLQYSWTTVCANSIIFHNLGPIEGL